MAQAKALGAFMGSSDFVFTSAAPRARQTAEIALATHHAHCGIWVFGRGRELYGPNGNEDFATYLGLEKVLGEKGLDPYWYRDYLAQDVTGTLGRFKSESREFILRQLGIANARCIRIFNHAINANAIGEALFSQHWEALLDIKLASCDGIRLTATNCQHLPL